MTGAWRFRASTAADVDQLYEVWRASVAATHDFVAGRDLETISVLVREEYLPHHVLWVAVNRDDDVIGFMGMTDHEIDSLFIHPDYRAMGLGKAFVAQAAAKSGSSSCYGSVVLEVEVNAQNLQAVGFYEKMGFRMVSSSPVDGHGLPYPLLRLQRPAQAEPV